MAATLADFETLQYCSIVNLGSLGWKAPLLQADYGAGYGAGVLANSSYGLQRWTLKSDIIPDTDSYSIDYDYDGSSGGTYSDPKFTYFYEFFKRHILRGNKPFFIKDYRQGKYFLVSFESPEVEFGRITAKYFTLDGLPVIERRHPDLTFNTDGSVVGFDDEAPSAPGLSSDGSGWLWSASSDNITAEEDLVYEIEIDIV